MNDGVSASVAHAKTGHLSMQIKTGIDIVLQERFAKSHNLSFPLTQVLPMRENG